MKCRIEECGYKAFALKHGFDLSKCNPASQDKMPEDDLNEDDPNEDDPNEDDPNEDNYYVYYRGVIVKEENPAVTFLINSSFYRTNPFFISCVKELKVENCKSTPIYYNDDECVYYIEKIPMYLAECASISEYDGAESINYEAGHFYKKAIPNLTPETVDDLKLFQQVFDYYVSRR